MPLLGPDEEEVDLEKQLKIYKEYLEATKTIHKMIRRKKFAYTREVGRSFLEPIFNPPPNLDTDGLQKIMLSVLKKLEPLVNLPEEVIERTISIQEKINQIRKLVDNNPQTNFSSLLNQAENKTDIIVTFLALLELIKQETIVVVQENIFKDITIKIHEETVTEE